ncbi:SDR family oxidoreductase (plasmid) [Pseudomonas sp. App30]|uniref:SDR family oxidoreductase n=1 Tax=Pseudomonas sp. App30 TaxID=3068990 RepID=UPI003A7FECBC
MSQKKVLITAGAGGIGRALAIAFIWEGAAVAVCDIDKLALDKLATEFPQIHTLVCDIAKPDQIDEMVKKAAQLLGGLDVLVNNAGISGPTAPADQLLLKDWERVMRINLDGTFCVTAAALPFLKQSCDGAIINMSSVAGRFGYANRIAYSTSKWGIIGFTKTLAIELGSYGIRVNAILPGAVDGPRFQQVLQGRAQLSGRTVEEETSKALGTQSLKYLVDPAHIADLAVFLASDSGRSISGQMLPIDCDMQNI